MGRRGGLIGMLGALACATVDAAFKASRQAEVERNRQIRAAENYRIKQLHAAERDRQRLIRAEENEKEKSAILLNDLPIWSTSRSKLLVTRPT